MKTTVVNIRTDDYDIYIGRRNTKYHFGNPFVIGPDGDRDEVIRKYDDWINERDFLDLDPERRKFIQVSLSTLKGKRLGCYCKPFA